MRRHRQNTSATEQPTAAPSRRPGFASARSLQFAKRPNQLIRPSGARNVVPDHAAKTVGLHRRHVVQQILNEGPAWGRAGAGDMAGPLGAGPLIAL